MAGVEIKNFTGLRCNLNGKTLDLPNNNLVSLSVNRVMGDSANAFTLEVYDDTAVDIEMILMNNKGHFPKIDVYYRGNANDPEQHFTGTIYDYVPTFVGGSMMLSITGYVGYSDNDYGLLAKSSISWVKPAEPFKFNWKEDKDKDGNVTNREPVADNNGTDAYMLSWLRFKDTKKDISLEQMIDENNQTLWCLPESIKEKDLDNIETYTYTDNWKEVNPKHPEQYLITDSATRTVYWKNADGDYEQLTYANFPLVYIIDELMEGYTQSTTLVAAVMTQGPGTTASQKVTHKLRTRPVISQQRVKPSEVFKRVINYLNQDKTLNIALGNVEETCWVYYSDWNQVSQTPYEFIEQVLCARSLGQDGNVGYYFYVDGKGKANFKKMGYYKQYAKTVNVEYGKKDSNVISFTTSQKGAVTMLGAVLDEEGNQSVDAEVINELTGDVTESNLIGATDVTNTNLGRVKADTTEYSKYTPKSINTSSSMNGIDVYTKWRKVSLLVSKAELKMWGTTQEGYAPGDYLQVNVMGRDALHYTTGVYWIIKENDSISKSGFVKTLTLIKTGDTRTESNSINAQEAAKSFGLTEKELYQRFLNGYTTDENVHVITEETAKKVIDDLAQYKGKAGVSLVIQRNRVVERPFMNITTETDLKMNLPNRLGTGGGFSFGGGSASGRWLSRR